MSNLNPDSTNETVEEIESIINERTRDWDDQYLSPRPEDGETEGEIRHNTESQTWNVLVISCDDAEGLPIK